MEEKQERWLAENTATDSFLKSSLEYIEQILKEDDDEQEGASSTSSPSTTLFHHVNPFALQEMEASFFRTLTHTQPREQSQMLAEVRSDKNHHPVNIFASSSYNNKCAVFSCTEGHTSCSSSGHAMSANALFQFQKGIEQASMFLPIKSASSWDDGFDANVKKKMRPSADPEKGITSRIDTIEGLKKSHTGSSLSSGEEDDLLEKFRNIFLDKGIKRELPLERMRELTSQGSTESLSAITTTARRRSSDAAGRNSVFRTNVVVDLHALVMICAGSICSGNHKNAYILLKEIRKHSSALGDGSQRLAHYYANAIEARLAGTGAQLYHELRTKLTYYDELKATIGVVSVCPFRIIHFTLIIHHISKLASTASTLHIVEFGIEGGVRVARIMDHLSATFSRSPLKVRVTGIEDPEASEMVKKTGQSLLSHYNIEYNGIAQDWETISKEDLKIKPNEAIAVLCWLRLHKLMDVVVEGDEPPRTRVLNLIREINPDIFVHFIANGPHSTPLFFPRFRESTYDYYAWFDMLDNKLSRYNGDRFLFEKFLLGAEIMNIVACEGPGRVERAETYRQWHIRTVRAGFKVSPVDKELLMTLFGMVRKGCMYKDFVIEEEEQWILQGWKGRTLCASSCWVPTPPQ